MTTANLNKLSKVIPEFVDERLMPSAPAAIKFILGGVTLTVLSNLDQYIKQYSPMLKAIQIVDEQNGINIEKLKTFINAGFEKSGNVPLYGFIFTPEDGNALIAILEKYKD